MVPPHSPIKVTRESTTSQAFSSPQREAQGVFTLAYNFYFLMCLKLKEVVLYRVIFLNIHSLSVSSVLCQFIESLQQAHANSQNTGPEYSTVKGCSQQPQGNRALGTQTTLRNNSQNEEDKEEAREVTIGRASLRSNWKAQFLALRERGGNQWRKGCERKVISNQ